MAERCIKCRKLSPTFVRKCERSVLFSDQAESSEVGQRNCFARKKNETGTINSSSSRVDICTAVLQRYIALASTNTFESCSVLPLSPHATLRSSHYSSPASIFSTMFFAAFVCLPTRFSLHFLSLVSKTVLDVDESLIQFLNFANVRVSGRPSHSLFLFLGMFCVNF